MLTFVYIIIFKNNVCEKFKKHRLARKPVLRQHSRLARAHLFPLTAYAIALSRSVNCLSLTYCYFANACYHTAVLYYYFLFFATGSLLLCGVKPTHSYYNNILFAPYCLSIAYQCLFLTCYK